MKNPQNKRGAIIVSEIVHVMKQRFLFFFGYFLELKKFDFILKNNR